MICLEREEFLRLAGKYKDTVFRVAVNVLGGTETPETGAADDFAPVPVTPERLQALADSIDFSIL